MQAVQQSADVTTSPHSVRSPAERQAKSAKAIVFAYLSDVERFQEIEIPQFVNGWGEPVNLATVRQCVNSFKELTGRVYITRRSMDTVTGYPLRVRRVQ